MTTLHKALVNGNRSPTKADLSDTGLLGVCARAEGVGCEGLRWWQGMRKCRLVVTLNEVAQQQDNLGSWGVGCGMRDARYGSTAGPFFWATRCLAPLFEDDFVPPPFAPAPSRDASITLCERGLDQHGIVRQRPRQRELHPRLRRTWVCDAYQRPSMPGDTPRGVALLPEWSCGAPTHQFPRQAGPQSPDPHPCRPNSQAPKGARRRWHMAKTAPAFGSCMWPKQAQDTPRTRDGNRLTKRSQMSRWVHGRVPLKIT